MENNENQKPNFTEIRRVLFWDTNMDKIDWQRQYRAAIQRIFERGNEREKNEIVRFYGRDLVSKELEKIGKSID